MAQAVPFIMAAGAVMSAVGAIQQGKAAKNAANYNAAIATNDARIAELQAQAEESRHRRMARKAIGGIRAAYGASGVTLEGTPTDVLYESVANAESDALNIRYGGLLRSQGFMNTAQLDRMQGKNAQTAGYMNAASSLLSGGAQTVEYKQNYDYLRAS